MRVAEGDHVRMTLINSEKSKHPHSVHFHSIYAGATPSVAMTSFGIPLTGSMSAGFTIGFMKG
jgi:hypothetical protein